MSRVSDLAAGAVGDAGDVASAMLGSDKHYGHFTEPMQRGLYLDSDGSPVADLQSGLRDAPEFEGRGTLS